MVEQSNDYTAFVSVIHGFTKSGLTYDEAVQYVISMVDESNPLPEGYRQPWSAHIRDIRNWTIVQSVLHLYQKD